ncbi:MAG: hypothetical protein ACRDJ9_33240 [Dehalococcoidia bacterium]
MSFWQRLVREAQRPASVGMAAAGTGLLAAGVVNPLLALAAVPVYALWGAYLTSRVLRAPDLRGDATREIEAQLEQVARLRYGEAHPPERDRSEDLSATRVRERFEELMAELDLVRGRERHESRPSPEEMSAQEFEGRLRQFRRIVEGEGTILNQLKTSPSGIRSLPAGLIADVAQLVNWAEAISRQRAEYLLILTRHPIEETRRRLEQKRREAARLPEAERADVLESAALLSSELERHDDLRREVRSIENQLDMVESLIHNLILSTPNVPSARDQIARVKRNVETYQTVNREVRERLEQQSRTFAQRQAEIGGDTRDGA